MSRIHKEQHQGKEIVVVDFSDLKEDQMIELLLELRTRLITGNMPELILAIFNDNSFLTPRFMKIFKTEKREETFPFIRKQAIIGLSETKRIILKGYNLFFNRNINAYNTKEEAIQFLTAD